MMKFMLVAAMVLMMSGLTFATEEHTQVDYKKVAREAGERRKKLAEAHPDMMGAFGALAKETLKDGALSTKTKELIAVALSVSAQCDVCITSHVQNAIKAGVTREEIAEAVGVAVLMGGGPKSVYAATVLEAYDQFSAK